MAFADKAPNLIAEILNNEIIPVVDAVPADNNIVSDETEEATDEYDPSEYATIG